MTPEKLSAAKTEHAEQRALFAWSFMAANKGFDAANSDSAYVGEYTGPVIPIPSLQRMFAIPNGGLRDKITAARLKAEGVKSGVPDVFLPVPCVVNNVVQACGLFIELKRETSGKGQQRRQKGSTSNDQDNWLDYLNSNGYAVVVAFGWREAADAIENYLGRMNK